MLLVEQAEQHIENKLNEFDYIAHTISEQAESSLRQFTKDHLWRKFTLTEIYTLLHTHETSATARKDIEKHLIYFSQAMT